MASVLKVDKLDPQSGTALEIGSSGDTITIPSGATFTQSGTMNASAITAGTVATARLGTGTASSSTVLYGDQTYKAAPGGGKILQVAYTVDESPAEVSDNSNSYVSTGVSVDITPSATTSKIYLTWNHICFPGSSSADEFHMTFFRDSTQLGDCLLNQNLGYWIPVAMGYVDEPSSTSAITYAAYFMSNQGNTVYGTNPNFSATITAWEIDGS